MDWKSKVNYPGDDANGERWAWEFLRRSPKYRRDYKRVRPHWDEELSHPKVMDVLERYKIGALGHPDDADECVFVAPPYDQTAAMNFHGGKYYTPQLEEYEAVFRFDLRYSIEEQLSVVKKELLRKRRLLKLPQVRKRDSAQTHRRYLQILDAIDAGATVGEIATALYARIGEAKKTFSVDRRRAEKLRDGGYLSLVRP